ncbi:MAG TPA: hypothetical protein VGG25_28380 [Streptosporangiaceae bacterium]|jgi:hypothetical protein
MTVEVRQSRDDADGLPARLSRLEGLAEELAQQGLRARLMTPPGRVPRLHVVNPAASALAEDIYVGRCQDGQWWFWWSWAERIASSQDVPSAAAQIGRVLAIRLTATSD